MVSKFYSPLKRIRIPWKIGDIRARAGKYMLVGNLVPESKDVPKTDRDIARGHRSWPKGALTSQCGTVLALM